MALHGSWCKDLRSGETKTVDLEPGQRAWVTHAELVDPTSAAAGQCVDVALRAMNGDNLIRIVLTAERPVSPVRSMVMLEEAFRLEREDDDSADSVVRFVGGWHKLLAMPETEAVEDGEDQEEAVLEEGEEDDDEEVKEEDGCSYVYLRSGETKLFALNLGQRAWVSHAQLVRPSSVAAGQTVRVALRTKTGDVQRLVLSADRNVVMVPSTVMLDEEFWLEREDDDCADMVVRFVVCDGNVHTIPEIETVEDWEGNVENQEAVPEEEDGDAVGSEDDEGEEMVEGTVYEMIVREESEDDGGYSEYDVDEDEEEESDGEFRVDGFMRVVDADPENQGGGGGDRQILVLYRYTRFSAAWSDGSVEARGSTKEHQLRFTAAAGHGARSLAWAGALLAPLIYPESCSKKLRELWTNLASQASLPPGAARVKVFVDVGILPQADYTTERKENLIAALASMMTEPWPTRFTGMELNLPEPLGCAHDEDKAAHDHCTDGEQRPAKRRRVAAAGEDCGVCLDLMEGDDLAAWPGCGKPHVFHGRCLELVLEKSKTCQPTCPICRRGLYIEPKF